jgi:transcriptional regulator with XRE-family HTH domain
MEEISRNIIAKNVKLIRLLLGLSQLNFALVTGISKASLINIESGKKGYNLDMLEGIIKFIGYSLSNLSSKSFSPEQDLREILIERYKKTESDYYNILSKTPEIVYAIRYKLLKSGSLDKPKEIFEIREELYRLYGWEYRSSSISNTLTRMKNLITVQPHTVKKNTNIYSKK